MHQTLLLLCLWLPCCLLTAGCSTSSLPPADDSQQDRSTSSDPSDVPSEPPPALSVPRLKPNPVVWLEDRREVDAVPLERQKAQQLMSIADRLKATERFAEAEDYYQQALAADSTWAYPAYQLACNYELWDRPDRAAATYKRAIELGFDDFPTAMTDDELGRIRELADFDATLAAIRERYLASSATRAGQPVAIRPQGEKPTAGWPMILLLHGYGDTNLSYLDIGQQWADLGFVAVAVPGSVPSRSDRFQWAGESTEPTHQDLQAIITSPLFEGLLNPRQVFLLGFSQGALHAMLLGAEQPERYAGVVSLSPGGSLADQLIPPPLNRDQRPGRCFFIHGTDEPHAPYVKIWSEACQQAGWPFDSRTHPGGHHFPDDWEQMLPEIATFLTQ